MTVDPTPAPRDASEVGSAAAIAAWAEAARPLLVEAAQRYRGLVRWKQLGEAVQAGTAITTTRPVATWIGEVLASVADDCASRGEPLLSALAVSAQGSVGEAYAETVERASGSRPEDPDEHAAEERLRCYRHWEAAGLPRDGGTPLRTAHFTPTKKAPARTSATRSPAGRTATPRTATPRTSSTRKAAAPKPPAPEPKPIRLCPTCFTQVPASGVCDYCD